MKKTVLLILTVFVLLSACATTKVTRIDSNTQTDLSGYWNDKDVKIVCESLINDCLSSQRVDQALKTFGKKIPVVIVGSFRNESSEHIDTAIISSIMETTIFNTGKMDFVAGGAARDALRAERQDQQVNASEKTAAALAKETGADFMLLGTVRTIIDKADNKTVRTYFVSAELTSIETNQRMWMGQNTEIKKIVVRPKNKL
jgi:penicillin-binding protein activator